MVSYIPEESFSINRTGSERISNYPGSLLAGKIANTLKYSLQIRGFKTDRSIVAELKRNPGMLSRIRGAFGEKQKSLNKTISTTTTLDLEGPSSRMDTAHVPVSAASGSETLSKLLQKVDETGLNGEQKQRLKVAFAEGYLAANSADGAKGSRTMKYLKVRISHFHSSRTYHRESYLQLFVGTSADRDYYCVPGHLLQSLLIHKWISL